MAGRKVLTATSGPGISLYSENIGLAIMGEVPMVIVNIQRQGPATGSATKGAEGDVLFTRWVTSGGQPVIVLSPATGTQEIRFLRGKSGPSTLEVGAKLPNGRDHGNGGIVHRKIVVRQGLSRSGCRRQRTLGQNVVGHLFH